jgi:hypothetical protein
MEVPILDSISGKRKFTVIKGGNTSRVGSKTREFVSAYVTDTRLMGVIGLYIHWTLSDLNGSTDLHQFFYLDAEEFGFETYRSLTGNDEGEFLFLEQSITGGLDPGFFRQKQQTWSAMAGRKERVFFFAQAQGGVFCPGKTSPGWEDVYANFI